MLIHLIDVRSFLEAQAVVDFNMGSEKDDVIVTSRSSLKFSVTPGLHVKWNVLKKVIYL